MRPHNPKNYGSYPGPGDLYDGPLYDDPDEELDDMPDPDYDMDPYPEGDIY